MIEKEMAMVWLFVTIVLYFAIKKLYQRTGRWWSTPLLVAPIILIILVLVFGIPFQTYYEYSHWLIWMLGPATVAFAVPIYQNRLIIKKHWFSLSCGVLVSMPLAVTSSVLFSRALGLSEMLQRSLATRSISTPFALMATQAVGGKADLSVLFVVITGVFGMLVGELMLVLCPIRSRLAKGALFGAAAHAAGTAKATERNPEEGVIASLTMMLGGLLTVFLAPCINWIF